MNTTTRTRRSRALVVTTTLLLLSSMLAAAVVRATPASATPQGAVGRIAYEGGFDDIYTINPDGSDAVSISPHEADDYGPAWSPDGKRIAFSSARDEAPRGIYVMDADGADVERVVPDHVWVSGRPVWSPDGTKLLAGSSYVIDLVTGGIAALPGGTFSSQPWSPDGTQLVYSTWTSSSSDIFVMDADGTGAVNLTNTPEEEEYAPAWSAEGRITYYTHSHPPPTYECALDIWVMDPDGSNRVNLTNDTAYDYLPLWSPDGSHLLFFSDRFNLSWTSDLVLMNADGTGAVALTDSISGEYGGYEFSPDGSQVAYTANYWDGAGFGLYVVSSDGTGRERLTNTDWGSSLSWQARNAPEAVDDGPYTVAEGATLDVGAPGVLGNDTDPNGDALTVSSADPAAHGTVVVGADGSFSYTHDGSETTDDSFTYVATDGTYESYVTTVTLEITPVNDAPVALDDGPYLVARGGTVTINGVLANDTDAEGTVLEAVLATGPSEGRVTLLADGSFLYQHDGTGRLADSFTYWASDGVLRSNVATVSMVVHETDETIDQVGLVDPDTGRWYLRNRAGRFQQFYYGNPGDYPMLGDWDCDGTETPGLYRQADGYVYLRNSNTVGVADLRFYFGNPGDVPLAGDFDGDGCDTVSLYRPSESRVYVINHLGSESRGLGAADHYYTFGDPGDKPFVGDFDGDGIDTIGLHRESTGLVYLSNVHRAGTADRQFVYGDPGDRMLCGSWVTPDFETMGVFRPADQKFYLQPSGVPGVPAIEIVFGEVNWMPVAGATGL